jgi:DNA-binding transcriptional ArsR family regulator
MADRAKRGLQEPRAKAPATEDVRPPDRSRSTTEDDAERALARMLGVGVPVSGVLGAIVVGQVGGLGPSILVLAGTALVATIGFLWASLRTLSGDAPLPEGVEGHALAARALAPERKRETLRALKDLEFEHSIGKIDDADYLTLSTRYRSVAKTLMRELDAGLAPQREKAEELVKAHLAKKKLSPAKDAPQSEAAPEESAESAPAENDPVRVVCDKCSVSNEPDAAFCKKCGNPLAKVVDAPKESPDATA